VKRIAAVQREILCQKISDNLDKCCD